MGPRLRKFIGSLGVVAFLAAYIVAVVAIAERLPSHWAAQIAFFALAGVLWGVPILPLFAWMQKKG